MMAIIRRLLLLPLLLAALRSDSSVGGAAVVTHQAAGGRTSRDLANAVGLPADDNKLKADFRVSTESNNKNIYNRKKPI